MAFYCPSCLALVHVDKLTAQLVQSLFAKCEVRGFCFLCEDCGKRVLDNYHIEWGLDV